MTYNLHDDVHTFLNYLVTDVTIVFMVALVNNTTIISNDYFVVRIGQKVPMWRHFLTQ